MADSHARAHSRAPARGVLEVMGKTKAHGQPTVRLSCKPPASGVQGGWEYLNILTNTYLLFSSGFSGSKMYCKVSLGGSGRSRNSLGFLASMRALAASHIS